MNFVRDKWGWYNAIRKSWCNGGFRQALSDDLRPAFKKFWVKSGRWSDNTQTGGSVLTSFDYFAFAAEKEVFGTTTYSTTNESDVLTQFTWYTTASNQMKKQGTSGSVTPWWERSAAYLSSGVMCACTASPIHPNPAIYADQLSNAGISPFGCM